MRLSLRTLLAFEDNVFDVEQHRRLEQLLPTDPDAEATLGRIRSIVRNPKLGVPGLVDHQEELDPNYVAEYLDHQMPANVQDQFESYCLSADKYLAEIASVHHILANVLGEPARTSRECRLKCYEVLSSNTLPSAETNGRSCTPFASPKHFRPFDEQETSPAKTTEKRFFAPFWNRFFASKKVQDKPQQPAPTEKNSLWSFTKIGLFVVALLFGWQQLEKQRVAHTLRNLTENVTVDHESVHENVFSDVAPENTIDDHFAAIADPQKAEIPASAAPPMIQQENIAEPMAVAVATEPIPPEPIEQTAFTAESAPSIVVPLEDPFAAATPPPIGQTADPFQAESVSQEHAMAEAMPMKEPPLTNVQNSPPQDVPAESTAKKKTSKEPTETIIAFQPIAAKQHVDQLLAKGPSEVPVRSIIRSPLPVTAWQSKETSVTPSDPSAAPTPLPMNAARHSQPIMQTSGTGTAPRILGRAVMSDPSHPNVIFSAATSESPWQLLPVPFDLSGNQYLLTATPFRGTFDLASGFRIEMIGDSKLCVLPLDASGTPGIFVDYGRIVIRPLKPNQSLRIETEKSSGIVSTAGTESVLFIDTFAELSDPPNKTKPPEEQKPKTGPILGFVPNKGEQIVWKSIAQPHPFLVNAQGSLLLQSDQYRFGEIRALPNWLGTLPIPQEDRILAEVCQRYFLEAGGNGEQALTRLVQDESSAIQTLGLRLWGDLGNFDVPLTVMSEKRKEDEAIRQVLVLYFNEVMLRDAETVQRFADAITLVKETQKR